MTEPTTTIEITDPELRMIKNALEAFVSGFGHDESDVLRAAQHLLAKLSATTASASTSRQPRL